MRRAAKKDTTQAAIVKSLRSFGYEVVDLGLPVDVAITHLTRWPANTWVMMEIKTPDKNGKPVMRKDRAAQQKFCALFGVPYVCSPQEALDWLNNYAVMVNK